MMNVSVFLLSDVSFCRDILWSVEIEKQLIYVNKTNGLFYSLHKQVKKDWKNTQMDKQYLNSCQLQEHKVNLLYLHFLYIKHH